jgi:hypothetical protein
VVFGSLAGGRAKCRARYRAKYRARRWPRHRAGRRHDTHPFGRLRARRRAVMVNGATMAASTIASGRCMRPSGRMATPPGRGSEGNRRSDGGSSAHCSANPTRPGSARFFMPVPCVFHAILASRAIGSRAIGSRAIASRAIGSRASGADRRLPALRGSAAPSGPKRGWRRSGSRHSSPRHRRTDRSATQMCGRTETARARQADNRKCCGQHGNSRPVACGAP